ncbi:MAG: hypothetical protein IJS75_01150 [Bacteroidales bacterium]|nr:hypothetical protein [Bacteroidales bacterium]
MKKYFFILSILSILYSVELFASNDVIRVQVEEPEKNTERPRDEEEPIQVKISVDVDMGLIYFNFYNLGGDVIIDVQNMCDGSYMEYEIDSSLPAVIPFSGEQGTWRILSVFDSGAVYEVYFEV